MVHVMLLSPNYLLLPCKGEEKVDVVLYMSREKKKLYAKLFSGRFSSFKAFLRGIFLIDFFSLLTRESHVADVAQEIRAGRRRRHLGAELLPVADVVDHFVEGVRHGVHGVHWRM